MARAHFSYFELWCSCSGQLLPRPRAVADQPKYLLSVLLYNVTKFSKEDVADPTWV